jgi:hypothetical protein
VVLVLVALCTAASATAMRATGAGVVAQPAKARSTSVDARKAAGGR